MNEVLGAIARWLEEQRRTDRVSAAVLAVLALGSGLAVFLLTTLLVYTILTLVCGAFVHSVLWLGLASLGLTAGFYARTVRGRQNNPDLGSDPTGSWIIKDVCSICPRLILAGLREVRYCGELGEVNVAACARALAYLAAQNAAVDWEELIRHCPQLPSERLREQLSLLNGVLFLGEHPETTAHGRPAQPNPAALSTRSNPCATVPPWRNPAAETSNHRRDKSHPIPSRISVGS